MAKVNIPDAAYAAAESALDAVHVCGHGGCCFRSIFSDVAVDTAAPLIVADYLERLVADLEAVKQEMRAVDARSIQLAGVTAAIVRTREHIAQLRGGAR